VIHIFKKRYLIIFLIALALFVVWRFIRPMNIFNVDDRFAWPVDTSQTPEVLGDLSAEGCAVCHQAFYDEWRTTIHSQAWTDPYFRIDWQFDGSQHSCRLCHTPLDRQQPEKVLAYRSKDKWDPLLEDNPAFDQKLQHEGVTCAACHYRDGKIVGVFGDTNTPHPVQKLDDPNRVCMRCHIVEGERWDTFFRFPPCGTVAEIKSTLATGKTGESTVINVSELGCVQCHMPVLKRPLVEGAVVRETRQHLWRGGHDPQMVKKALTIEFTEDNQVAENKRMFKVNISNTGAAHYVPTGTPDRHLTVALRLLDAEGLILREKMHTIKRTVMWRPFIVDLWDTRLPRGQVRQYELEVPADSEAVTAEVEVRYHLLDESRRKRISYENTTPINYEVYHKQISLR